MRPLPRTALALLPLMAGLLCLPSHAAAPKDRWEVTSSLQIGGMALPTTTRSLCLERGAEDQEPPMPEQSDCRVTSVQRSGNTTRWALQCPQGSGSFEMTRQSADAYTGQLHMTQNGQPVGMQISGKRLGACTAEAPDLNAQLQAAAAALQVQANAALQQGCAQAAQTLSLAYFTQPGLACSAEHRAVLCARAQSPEGLAVLASRPRQAGVPGGDDLATAGQLCGVDLLAQRQRVCAQADAHDDATTLASTCVGEGRSGLKLVQRECVGRTDAQPPASAYREFCSRYAEAGLVPAAPVDKAAERKAKLEEALNKGKDLIKGLLK